MDSLQTLFVLVFAAVLLIGIAQRLRIPYPIVLVVAGAIIGFIPGLEVINFDSNTLLLIVLPPILYYAAFGIPFREFKKNWKSIFSLALGLVICSTIVIAVFFKYLFPQFSWPLAFTFGAIVSPPDAVAATTILKRFAINPRLISILEGESLVNDASAIILYKFSVASILIGSFSFIASGVAFLHLAIGGILLGLVLGFLFQFFSKYYLEPVIGVLFSFCIPYITYILASLLHVSGVLAVVVNGLIGSRLVHIHRSSLRRVLGFATWDIFTIFLNCFIFILIGLELKIITQAMSDKEMLLYTLYSFGIFIALIAVRMLWIYTHIFVSNLNWNKNDKKREKNKWILAEAFIIAWSGMRGIVSLALALALPFTLINGSLLEGRDEVIFMTFVVILLTLIIPGLSLSKVILWMKLQHHNQWDDESKAREELAKVVEKNLLHLRNQEKINATEFELLKSYFISQHQVLEIYHSGSDTQMESLEMARIEVIKSQRHKLLELWKQQEIDDKLLSHLENELDLVEVHIARADL